MPHHHLLRNAFSWTTAAVLTTALLVASLMLWDATLSSSHADPLQHQPPAEQDRPRAREVRAEVAATRSSNPGPAPSSLHGASFQELFDRLASLYLVGMQADTRGDTEGAEAVSETATDLRTRMIRHADAGPEALRIAQGLPVFTMTEPPATHVRRSIALQLLTGVLALNRKKALSGSEQSQRDNDDLVHAVLAGVPAGPGSAALAAASLPREPYLRHCHEGQVFALAEISLGRPSLRELVSDLLYTLWNNLRQVRGAPGELLDSIVLAHRTSELDSTRIAAWRYLLRHGNHAIRDMVLQQVLDLRDLGSMRVLGLSVVACLPPRESLAILQQLAPACSGHLTSAYLNLGFKARPLIHEEYMRCLASQTHPNHRAQLVNASVFMGSDLSELALQHDQDPRVQANALLIVSGHSTPEICEAELHRALDSRSLGESSRVSIVVTALMTMARRSSDPNRIARVLQRLETNPHLGSNDIARLKQIRSQYLPR